MVEPRRNSSWEGTLAGKKTKTVIKFQIKYDRKCCLSGDVINIDRIGVNKIH